MGRRVPPLPLMGKELERANKLWAEGCRDMKQLDPRLHEWLEEGRAYRNFGAICLVAGVLVLIGIFVVIFTKNQF